MPPKVGQRATVEDAKAHGMGKMDEKYEVNKKKPMGTITGGKTSKQREQAKHTK